MSLPRHNVAPQSLIYEDHVHFIAMNSHRYERLLAQDDIELQVSLLSLSIKREHLGLPPRRFKRPSNQYSPPIFDACLPTNNQKVDKKTTCNEPGNIDDLLAKPLVSDNVFHSIVIAAAHAKKDDLFSRPPSDDHQPQRPRNNAVNQKISPVSQIQASSSPICPNCAGRVTPRNNQSVNEPTEQLEQPFNKSRQNPTPNLQSSPVAPSFRTARSRLIRKRKLLGQPNTNNAQQNTSGGTGGMGGAGGSSVAGTATRAVLGSAKRARFSAPRPNATKQNQQTTRDDLPEIPNVEPQLVETVMNEALEDSPNVDWDDIAGLQFAKKCVMEAVVWPMKRPDIFTGLRGPPRGLLLFGPPGTGKTMIGKAIASKSGAKFFNISASSMVSKWVGESEKLIRALFAVARHFQPSVIFIDEIDSMLTKRSGGEHEHSRRLKTEFLVQMDGAATSREDRILVVGATNLPQELDEAARRRLVKRLYIPLPDDAARGSLVSRLLQKQTNSLSEADIQHIAKLTDGYSGSDMYALCAEAALGPVRELGDALGEIDVDKVRAVDVKDFEFAAKMVRASVSQNDLKGYIEWNDSFGSFPMNGDGTPK